MAEPSAVWGVRPCWRSARGVDGGGAVRADDADVAAEPPGAGAGEFGADQEAREAGVGGGGVEAAQQPLGAEREEARGQRSGRERASETASRKAASSQPSPHRVAENGVFSDGCEELTRHEGLETDDLAGADRGPFGMGAGQAEDAVEARVAGRGSRRSGFLRRASRRRGSPASGRGSRRTAEAGVAGGGGDGLEVERAAGGGGVGRLGPALAAADHAAGDDLGFLVAAKGLRGRGGRVRTRRGARRPMPLSDWASARTSSASDMAQARRLRGAPVDGDPVGVSRASVIPSPRRRRP